MALVKSVDLTKLTVQPKITVTPKTTTTTLAVKTRTQLAPAAAATKTKTASPAAAATALRVVEHTLTAAPVTPTKTLQPGPSVADLTKLAAHEIVVQATPPPDDPNVKKHEDITDANLLRLAEHAARGEYPTVAPPSGGDDPADELGDTWQNFAPYMIEADGRTLQGVERWATSPLKGPKPPLEVVEYIKQGLQSGAWPANVVLGVRAALMVVRKGIPYVWGGTDPNRGLDCSGFAQYVLRVAGDRTLHRTTYEQATQGRLVKPQHRQPLDLCFFEPGAAGPGHVAIYLAQGWAVHEPHTGLDAQWLNLATWTPLYTRRYLKDIPGGETQTPAPDTHVAPAGPANYNKARSAWRELMHHLANEWPAVGRRHRGYGDSVWSAVHSRK